MGREGGSRCGNPDSRSRAHPHARPPRHSRPGYGNMRALGRRTSASASTIEASPAEFVPDLCHLAMKTGCNPCQWMQPGAKLFLDGR